VIVNGEPAEIFKKVILYLNTLSRVCVERPKECINALKQ
jgi:hypothetical protein